MENCSKLDQTEGENFAVGIWQIKKKSFNKKGSSIPAAKVDINGQSVTNAEGVSKKSYILKALSIC